MNEKVSGALMGAVILLLAGCQRNESSGINKLMGGSEASPAGVVQTQKKPAPGEPVIYSFKGETGDGEKVAGTLTITPTAFHPDEAPPNIYRIPATTEFTVGKDLKVTGLSVLDAIVEGGTLTFREFSVNLNDSRGLFTLALSFGESFSPETLNEQLLRLEDMGLTGSEFAIAAYDGPPVDLQGSLTKLKKGRAA